MGSIKIKNRKDRREKGIKEFKMRRSEFVNGMKGEDGLGRI